jgi:hypothetical protein
MNRIRISANLTLGKYIVVALTVYLLYFIFFVGVDNQTKLAYCVGIIIFGIAFYLFHHSKKVEFDDDCMYITDRKKTQIIPLQNVYKIKLTMTSINNANLWKIGYYDETGQSKAIRILPKFFSEGFETFKRTVKVKNDNVKIKNWSHSFDFDQ